MQIPTIVGAGLIVIGAGLGIGSFRKNPNSYAYCCCVNWRYWFRCIICCL